MFRTKETSSGAGHKVVERVLNSSPVYSAEDLEASIREVFLVKGLGDLSAGMSDAILLSIVSLLQDCRFVDSDENEVGKLLIAFNASRIALLAQVQADTGDQVLFSVLSIENKFINFSSVDATNVAGLPNNFISVEGSQSQIFVNSI